MCFHNKLFIKVNVPGIREKTLTLTNCYQMRELFFFIGYLELNCRHLYGKWLYVLNKGNHINTITKLGKLDGPGHFRQNYYKNTSNKKTSV